MVWRRLQADAIELGFSQIGVSGVDLASAEPGFLAWLEAGFAGEMRYMAEHGLKRLRPAELLPGTVRVVTARMDYLTGPQSEPSSASGTEGAGGPHLAPPDWRAMEWRGLGMPGQAAVSLYARGRDYHRVLRPRLAELARRLQKMVGPLGHRAFTDSAPVAEVELAQRSGLGWRGKHTLLLHRDAGSMFFLGEVFIDLPLPLTPQPQEHCGQCTACLQACPTQAIVAPYRLDARRCISYLTIEHPGPIDEPLRGLMGNRIYGCDDCQLACPWNKYARLSPLPDFRPRPWARDPELLVLWSWTEADFLTHTQGSAIRRIGYERWRRNLAVAIGNGLHARPHTGSSDQAAVASLWAADARMALQAAWAQSTPLVREHIDWALGEPPPPLRSAAPSGESPQPSGGMG